MDVFSQTTAQSQEGTQEQTSFLEKLVQVKGENFKDIEVLAKSKLESDEYIKTLEAQTKELREELSKQEYSKELLNQLQNKATASTTVNSGETKQSGTSTEGDTKSKSEEVDIKSLVNQALSEREQLKVTETNLSIVSAELEKDFGTEAAAKVQEKAKELGLTVERLKEIAAESPTAFFNLIGKQVKPSPNLSNSSIRTEGVKFSGNSIRNWEYYSKLRKENKTLYFSPSIQQQMLEDKKQLGANFGN